MWGQDVVAKEDDLVPGEINYFISKTNYVGS